LQHQHPDRTIHQLLKHLTTYPEKFTKQEKDTAQNWK